MEIDMEQDLDEKVYAFSSINGLGSIEAIGVCHPDGNGHHYVGFYIGNFWKNKDQILNNVMQSYGDARLYSLNTLLPPSLACQMEYEGGKIVLGNDFENYKKIKLDLLEMRAERMPKVFLKLSKKVNMCFWDYQTKSYFEKTAAKVS